MRRVHTLIMITILACCAGALAQPETPSIRQMDLFGISVRDILNAKHPDVNGPDNPLWKKTIRRLRAKGLVPKEAPMGGLYMCLRDANKHRFLLTEVIQSESEGTRISLSADPIEVKESCKDVASSIYNNVINVSTPLTQPVSINFPNIIIGKTTKEEVKLLFGKPSSVGAVDNRGKKNSLVYPVKRDFEKQKECKAGPAIIGAVFSFDRHDVLEKISIEDSISGEC